MIHRVKSVHIEYNTFNSCTALNHFGGGMYVFTISECVRISGCEFKSCKAKSYGGGINLDGFQVLETNCIGSENGGGESACVFYCSFTSCFVVNDNGGGLRCRNIPNQFKMRSIRFISCNASSNGGGLCLDPQMATVSSNSHYCYFIFFHNCNCTSSTPYGHDVYFEDDNNLFSSSNPFYESYTTNTNDERVCFNGSSLQMTEKKWWLNEGPKDRYVGENGDDTRSLCGMSEAVPCKTVGFVVFVSLMQSSSTTTVLSGKHQSEISTIDIGDKIISVVGNGREESLIGTKSLSVSSTTLFSVKSGQLNVQHLGIDHNTTRDFSPNVFVVSSGSGALSLEDVLINSSISEESVISSSVFVMALSQLRMSDVEIKNIKISQQLFAEPSSAGSTSGESMLVNVTVRNVNRYEGDGVVVEKSIKGGEKFSVQNVSIENCVCKEGNGGGICVCLTDDGEVVMNGISVIDGCIAVGIEGNGGRGGGMFVEMESGGCGLTIGENVEFSKVIENKASYGKDVFVSCGSGVFLESKVNKSSFAFFDTSAIPSDVLKLSGNENGEESEVIPLFVYLCSMGTKVIVDGSGGNGKDHNHCGYDAFRCQTVDYCANSRLSESSNEIEVVTSSSIKDEIAISSFCVIISGRIESSSSEEGERMQVNVSDGGSASQEWLVGCSSSLAMRRLSFVVKGQLKSRRSAFIHSTSTLSVTNCSISFESGALTNGKIGYNIIDMTGGNLIVDGFVMESGVTLTMNGKSPITMSNGAELEISNSRMSGNDWRKWKWKWRRGIFEYCDDGRRKCKGCEVPTEDREEGGRGIGGGMFMKLPDQMGAFVLEGMTFEGCDGWKGKNMFVSGWDLREIVNKEHFKWEMSSEELGSLDELCGWERKTTGEGGYVIPLVVYLWDNWSGNGFVSKDEGGDFSGCGFSEAPCLSIDHLISLRYSTLGECKSHIKIVGSGLLQKSMSLLSSSSLTTPIVSVEGEREGTDLKVNDGGMDKDEEGEGMISSNIIVSFINISFSLPNELGMHLSFIHSLSSSSATLSVVRCSFACEDETMKVNYCLIKADGGRIVIEDCTLSQFLLAKGFVEFTTDVNTVDVMNMSISNTTIYENTLISLSQPSATDMLINNAMENTKQTVKVNCSSFANITCLENRACVMSAGSFSAGMECVVEGCAMTKCMSEKSVEGGGMKMLLKRGVSELKVSGCSLGMCACSTVNGRGGGMMIDALDPNVKNTNTEMPPLGLRLENIRFMMNDAFIGKDVFIRCDSIASQINERLFGLDFDQEALRGKDSICGSDGEGKTDINLIPFITFFFGQQVFISVNGSNNRQCGAQTNPCKSVSCSVSHIQRGVGNVIWIDGEGDIGGECVVGDLCVKSMKKAKGTIHFNEAIQEMGSEGSVIVFVNECVVERCVHEFGELFEANHRCIMKVKNGTTMMRECEFLSSTSELAIKSIVMSVEGGELEMDKCVVTRMKLRVPLMEFIGESKAIISETRIDDLKSEGNVIEIGDTAKVELKELDAENITISRSGSVAKIQNAAKKVGLSNCSFGKCLSSKEKGTIVFVNNSVDAIFDSCNFFGDLGNEAKEESRRNDRTDEICKWNGSLVNVVKSSVKMKDTTIANSPDGGITMSGGKMIIEAGNFSNNNPSIEGYPSLRRNIICSDSGTLNVMSLKGGDGLERNTSLWMLNDGCNFEGIVSERDSSFFIPVLECVEAKEEAYRMKLTFKGMLLVPCNLSFSVVKKKGEEKEIEHYDFDSKGFLSERKVEGNVEKNLISSCGNEIEVSVCVLFGNSESPSSTNSFILKNASETNIKDDGRIVEGGKEGKSYWLLIVIVCIVIVVLLFVIVIILAVRWRKAKNEAKDLREIVNDNIRKDPKAFEMVTMEMSPEEQWRRAEREAEKKNEERIKKRIYDSNMQHSESSEHLLSESGSTEYILGKDSDKIPQWMLEKDEEEEIRKRTPSPSISSTSTTSTTDSDSTFVRMEDMCPTTSSMSNLVDAMACSSPHEKLIVDLRDSLFMLLHGRNEKKEMAIGTLQEREQTAAQILFWVANLALHSFDEMENPLQSLANLSPHIVLFSEHMVICVVMHSDFLSSDDSDSSSISSSTVATSASDDDGDDDSDSLPSSAFEDEDDNKKECMRWMAPELLMNRKMGATKKSVVFSIGMMLWECLTLEIPFGEYPAEVAGQKIANGERPDVAKAGSPDGVKAIIACLSMDQHTRPTLTDLKRAFISHFPAGCAVLTVSDAIGLEETTDRGKRESGSAQSGDAQSGSVVSGYSTFE
ncbi:uncharacterized protein MONOS_1496 [Monocercomonoides exilis]|uniref:uncharacterized protein n=1 Tax=Monocercomonoides exilis TaxID=2049356 RepID=UPI00355977C3|nr:hypothetical protein MONOS_1496 [Monocercomonoides exilis]|eukprot:MONOS_1496.1-p1 / transcript=MONOS_1496.1 / gene=MONOS_1496 / organism=Monocercomonoides_exilis_PA203 / gene_product=unspecified product / transcript_product=unspecified product / location=Mono_scaffold00026:169593-176511(+) / protein_length=2266 / sequence_SO=supercontig / SO=protein_coding / is_pseudo=false